MSIALGSKEYRRRAERIRWMIGILASAGMIAAFVWMATTRFRPAETATTQEPPHPVQTRPAVIGDSAVIGDTTALGVVPYAPDTTPAESNSVHDTAVVPGVLPPAAPYVTSGRLLIPVAGVRPEQLRDTYNEARSEGRVHNAIDIPAPQGTPVVAAADGKIVKLFQSERGGTTIYQLGGDGKTVYYYAHLQRYADALAEGKIAHRGDTIAYVGDTGNAGAGNYHLHFGITIVDDPKHYWGGTDVNPYPLLHGDQ
jgi:murein DD-endopeptidase MepM/ murein hydrolase activator NlpD